MGKKILDKYVSYPPNQSIIEVCDYWLRNHTGQPTWNEVAAALKQIGLMKLAHDIEKVYETGILPYYNNVHYVICHFLKSMYIHTHVGYTNM